MVCGLAIAATVFAIITLVFEILGVIFCLLSLIFPEKNVGLTFSKWFIISHIGVYAGTLIFYVFHFFIKNYTYDEKQYELSGADDWKNYKKYDFCFFAIPKSFKNQYPGGNGYKVYWGHIFLFIVGIVGVIVSILYLLPVVKVFGLLYVIVGFVHIFIVWVVFLSVSVPNMSGAHTPGIVERRGLTYGWDYGYSTMCTNWLSNPWALTYNGGVCPFVDGYSRSVMGLCGAFPTKWEFTGYTFEVPADWAFHGCDNGQEVSSTRNFNFLFIISKKAIEAQLRAVEPLNNDIVEFHRNGYHPWFFNYELVFFIMMSVFYVGFVLVNFNIDFRGTLLKEKY